MLKQARNPETRKRLRESGRKTAIFAGSSGDWRKPTVCTTRPPARFGTPLPKRDRGFFFTRRGEGDIGDMPNLTVEQQRELGVAVAKLLTPMPLDERLLLLVACLYGEGRSQGLTASEVVHFCERICAIHEAGALVHAARSQACPLCGTPRASRGAS